MMQYELLYILPTTISEADRSAHIQKIEQLLRSKGAEETTSSVLAIRHFSYPLKQHTHGAYIHLSFSAPSHAIQSIDREFQLDQEILRHAITETTPMGKKHKETREKLLRYIKDSQIKQHPGRTKRKKFSSVPGEQKSVEAIQKESTPARIQKQDEITAPQKVQQEKVNMEELEEKLDKILDADMSDLNL